MNEQGSGWRVLVVAAWLLTASAATISSSHAASYADVPGCREASLPSEDARYPAPQLVVTCLPTGNGTRPWNGTLIVAIHGYVEPQEPLVLPAVDMGGTDAARLLLDLGFAFATTSFHKNGYAVEQAGNDVTALVRYFNSAVSPTSRVLLLGASEGAAIATMLIERDPSPYAGALALCGPLGGANTEIDYVGDFRVVFDYLFPQVFDFGVVDIPASALQNWEGYKATVKAVLAAEPEKAEQLFRVTGVARDPNLPTDIATFEATERLLRYNVGGFADLVQVAGGNPYDNQNRTYAGSSNDAALNRGVERVTASPAARNYLNQFYQPTGRLTRPLVILHTRQDPIVPFMHALEYVQAAERADADDQLSAFAVNRYGHCNFTTSEVLGSIVLLMDRADVSLSSR